MIGYLIGKYPHIFLVSTFVILIPLFSLFFIYPIHIDTDVRRGFAHRNGRSINEFQTFARIYNVSMEDMELLIVLVESKNEDQLQLPMNAHFLDEMKRLYEFVTSQWVPTLDGQNLTLKELEIANSSVNFLFHVFKFGYDWQQTILNSNALFDPNIHLDFPISRIFGHDVSISSHFLGVERYEHRPADQVSMIKSIRNAVLWFMLDVKGQEQRKYLREIELKIFEMSRHNFSDLFNFHVYSDEIINNEMMIGSKRTARLLIIGLFVMFLFMGITLRDFKIKQIILLTIASVGSPMFAMATTFALLNFMGVGINSMMSISPFLVLGIGVDDAFLLVHSWRKYSRISSNRIKIVEMVISNVAPSVTITSVTNVLAFSVGILSPASQISSFCLCTATAVALDYIFEFTIFVPVLALCKPSSDDKTKLTCENVENSIWSRYASLLLTTWGRLLCVLTLLTLISVSSFGIRTMKTDFDPQKTFPSDSHLQKTLQPINNLYVDYKPLSFIIQNAPDIGNATQLDEFFQMVGRIEKLNNNRFNNTQLWLRDYIKYDRRRHLKQNKTKTYRPSYTSTPQFLSDRLMEDKKIVFYHREGSEVVIDNFVFLVVFNGKRNWHERAFFVEEIRNLIDEYPQFNVTVFDYDSTIFDLIITVKSEMLKAVIVVLTCMIIVCFFFIPNLKYTSFAVLSIISISFSFLGLLGWSGNEFDPVTLINVLMSIGLSVDFTAHICYHYWQHTTHQNRLLEHDESSKTEHHHLVMSLSAVGRPMIEAALSTCICVFPLFFVRIYVVVSFAKTVLCISFLGLIHGLFILPVFLTIPLPSRCAKRKTNAERELQLNDSDHPLMPVLL